MIAALVAGWLAVAVPVGEVANAGAVALVDLNTADVRTLCTLPGIGPKKAEAIVLLRQKRPLTRVTQLLQVRGIGPRILDRLRGKVTLRPPPASDGGGPRFAGPQADVALRLGAAPRP